MKTKVLSEAVRQAFEKDKFAYFTNNQAKIDDFLPGKSISSEPSSSNQRSLISPDEWNYIKQTYLQKPTKKKTALKSIRKRIKQYENSGTGMWK